MARLIPRQTGLCLQFYFTDRHFFICSVEGGFYGFQVGGKQIHFRPAGRHIGKQGVLFIRDTCESVRQRRVVVPRYFLLPLQGFCFFIQLGAFPGKLRIFVIECLRLFPELDFQALAGLFFPSMPTFKMALCFSVSTILALSSCINRTG